MTAAPSLLLLAPAMPIALWAIWSDLARMKIPNLAVLALAAAFAVFGLLVLPLPEYGVRWMQGGIVLAAGFLLASVRAIGAGDAKFAAAMAPYVAPGERMDFALLFAVVLLVSFALQRLARAIPALRAAAPGWESWERRDFPAGIALGSTLVIYLAT